MFFWFFDKNNLLSKFKLFVFLVFDDLFYFCYYLFIYYSFIGLILIVFIWAHSILILAQPRSNLSPTFHTQMWELILTILFSFLISTIHFKSQTLKAHFSPFYRPLTASILSHSSSLIFLSFSFPFFFLSISSFFISSFLHFFINSTTAKLSSAVLLFALLPIVVSLTLRLYIPHFYIF